MTFSLIIPINFNGEIIGTEITNDYLITENKLKENQVLEEIEKITKLAIEAEDNKEYEKAINFLEKGLKIEKNFFGENNINVADTLQWIARIYRQKSEFEKSENFYKQSLRIKNDLLGDKDFQLVDIHFNLGYLDERKGNDFYQNAEAHYLKALEIVKNSYSEEHEDYLYGLYLLGNLYSEKGLFEKANDILTRTLKLEEKTLVKDNLEVAGTLFAIGRNYNNSGQFKKAESFFLRALEIYKQKLGFNNEDTAITLNALGENYLELGLYNEAEKNIQKALSIKEKILSPDEKSIATSLNDLALVNWYKGEYSEAEPLLLRALSIRKKAYGNESEYTAVIYSNLALIYSSQYLYDKSIEFNKKAYDIRKKVYGENHHITLISSNNLATNYLSKNDFDNAEKILTKVLNEHKKVFGLISAPVALTSHTLSGLYLETGEYEKAKPLIDKSLDIYKNLFGLQHPSTALSISTLASYYRYMGLNEKAIKLYEEALDIDRKIYGKDSYELFQLTPLAYLNLEEGNYQKSKLFFLERLKNELTFIQKELPFLPSKDREILVKEVNPINPGTLYSIFKNQNGKELSLFARLNRQGLIQEIERNQMRLSKLLDPKEKIIDEIRIINNRIAPFKEYSSEIGSLKEKKELLEKKLYRKLPIIKPKIIEVSQVANALPKKSILIEFQKYKPYTQETFFGIGINYVKEKNKGIKVLKVFKDSPSDKAGIKTGDIILSINNISSTGRNYSDAENELFNNFAKKFDFLILRNNKKINKSIVKANFNIGWASREERYLAILLNSKRKISAFDIGSAENIHKIISKALYETEEGLAGAQQRWKEVGDVVIKPLKESIGDAETLFISPDAELNRVPFAAISSHKDDQLLGDAVKIRLLTTGRELLDLAKRSKSSKQKSLVVANPAFDLVKTNQSKKESNLIVSNTSQQRSGDLDSFNWSPLPGTAKEGEVIAKLTKAQLLTKDNATALALQEKEAPKILHIASHAYYLPDQGKGENPLLRSGIVLAGANEPETNPKDDGYLTALEVAKVDWQGTELVAISACESGKGDIQSGEGVYGLKRAIAVAGARSSLLSLWKVDDIATADFMEKFYQKLKDGMGRSEALAETQKEFKNHSITRFRHPYYWAAFQLSGDWRPIDF